MDAEDVTQVSIVTGTNGHSTEQRNSADEGDARGNSGLARAPVLARMPTARDDDYYNMNHPKRGYAVIFNHELFDVHGLKSRSGTNIDCTKLKDVLVSLGFQVTVFENLTYRDLSARVANLAAMDHTHQDCVLMCVLTHGELGMLYAKDTFYKSDSLWHSFTADKCPTLAGKPKLFFVQACQGDKLDGGVMMSERTETDGPAVAIHRIPIHADFLICYSTVPGFYSWRNTTRGSWFIQALTEELRLHGRQRDLLTLMTFVARRVAYDYESNTPDSPVMHQQKQIPCITSMLTRLVRF